MEKKRILVVDDEEAVLKSFREILELKGYSIDTARTGQQAIEKSKQSFYNLAMLDIRLPDMEGTELLAKMREATPKMIKIMVTGYPSLQNAIEAVNKGADSYIVKPVDVDKLLNTVKEHLRKQEEAKKYSEEKVKEYIETRAREAHANSTRNLSVG